jgi:hypothetical protein
MITFGFASTQIAAVPCAGVAIGTRYMEHGGTTEIGETVGCSSGSGEFSPCGRALPR